MKGAGKWLILIVMAAGLKVVAAQDVYQVLRDQGQGFAEVVRGKPLVFPRDHLAHPQYRIEWWYITANLQDDQGRDWGLQWTLFRQSLSPEVITEGWGSNQLWMAHAALTTPQQHTFEQRFARGGIGQAGVHNKGIFEAWLDDWRWHSQTGELFPSQLHYSVAGSDVVMQLESHSDWVLHGDKGYSQKSTQGQASYYYSQPDISISGHVQVDGKVIPLQGTAWLDREWSSQALAENQQGWDWFSLHLDDGNKLMLYRLRHDQGPHWLSGSWIGSNGQITHLNKHDIELNPVATRVIQTSKEKTIKLPLEWEIGLPGYTRKWIVKTLYDEQWMETRFPYWEGVVLVEDAAGQPAGRGYMELTGYE